VCCVECRHLGQASSHREGKDSLSKRDNGAGRIFRLSITAWKSGTMGSSDLGARGLGRLGGLGSFCDPELRGQASTGGKVPPKRPVG
jgi:hypothetical protein